MTIDEAISRLNQIAENQDEDWLDFEYAALQLGIEALKRIQSRERIKGMKPFEPLPGETEE